MKKEILIILIFSISAVCLNAQEKTPGNLRSDSIELVKDLMRKNGSVTSYAIGYSGRQSNQFQRFLYLLNSLNNNDLFDLLKDSSACLRIYAYAGLIYNRYKKIDPFTSTFKNDTTLIPHMRGCGIGNVRINAIISSLTKWYSSKGTKHALKEQNKDPLYWYTNFVFRD